jgi:hypothetical protein
MHIYRSLSFAVLVASLQRGGCYGQATTVNATFQLSSAADGIPASTPEDCRAISSDRDFPPLSVWMAQLPDVKASHGTITGDYRLRAKSVADVQAAIKFAVTHNVRLTTICSGHDWLDR